MPTPKQAFASTSVWSTAALLLCAVVAAVLEKLLRPKRATFTDKQRDEVHEAQGHRCAICDAELRAGEDHGDHCDPL